MDLGRWKTAFSEGVHESIEAVMGTAVILDSAVSTVIPAGLLASATGSASLVMETLGDVYLNSGANLSIIHRIVSQMALIRCRTAAPWSPCSA